LGFGIDMRLDLKGHDGVPAERYLSSIGLKSYLDIQ
jgi:hypothetical protein